MRIIIIGNAEINENYGQKIDNFDIVVRMNAFKIKGFEDKIGSKTDIVVGLKHKDLSYYSNVNEIIIPLLEQNYTFPYEIKDKIKYIKTELLKKVYDKFKYPSTGLRILYYILDKYKNDDIYIIGFDGFKSNHYFNKNDVMWDKHEGDKEMEFINQLIFDKKIRQLK